MKSPGVFNVADFIRLREDATGQSRLGLKVREVADDRAQSGILEVITDSEREMQP
jgi:hypothetical protein